MASARVVCVLRVYTTYVMGVCVPWGGLVTPTGNDEGARKDDDDGDARRRGRRSTRLRV